MTFCAFKWVSVLCHLPSSRDHVDIHKKVKLCPLVPSGADISYMCLNDPADRINFNFSKKFDKILFTSCDWAVKCYVIVNDVVIVLLYITLCRI